MIPDIPDGLWFEASKRLTLSYRGAAKVIKKKKNGLYLCEGAGGCNFELSKSDIAWCKRYESQEFVNSLKHLPIDLGDGWKEVVL